MAKAKKPADETQDPETPSAPKKVTAKKKAPGAAAASQVESSAGAPAPVEKPAAKKKAPGAAAASQGDAPPAAAAKASTPAAKKPAAKPATTGAGSIFGIDTDFAAQAAAKMLLNRPSTPASGGGGTVKSLKNSLGKPAVPNLGNLLGGGSGGSGKSSNLPHFGGQQKGHNQATGHVGNTGVPRRTPG